MTAPTCSRAVRATLGIAVLSAVLSPALAQSAPGETVKLAPHRAIYELSLATTRGGGSGVTSVAGRMAYDLTGSTCEGYTQGMRFVTRMTNQSGNIIVTDLRSSTWEDGAAKRFRFDSSQHRDEKSTEATAGDAVRPGAGDIKVELTKPAKRNISLPSRVHFPVQHTIAMLLAAKAGKTSFRADLYDGSEKGEKVYDTVAAIGRVQPAANSKLPPIKYGERLTGQKAWPVSIAYFEPGSDRSDALPIYEMAFLMFENGVSRSLYIDYGEFALQGELTELMFYDPSKCDVK